MKDLTANLLPPTSLMLVTGARRSHLLGWAAGTLLVLPAAAQNSPPKQEKHDLQQEIATAQQLREEGRRDEALLLVWRLDTVLRHLPASPERTRDQAAVEPLLQDLDPQLAPRRAALAAAAKRFQALAASYQQKKWFDQAGVCLRFAGELEPEAGIKSLQELMQARSMAQRASALPAALASDPGGLLSKAKSDKLGDWWLDQIGTLRSSPLGAVKDEPESAGWLTDHRQADHQISCECYLGPGDAWFDFVIGATDIHNCHVFGLSVWPVARTQSVLGGRIVENAYQRLAGFVGRLAGDADGFHHLVLHVRGSEVDVEVDGQVLGTCTAAIDIRGRVGFLVSGNNTARGTMWFRRLHIGPPTAPPADPVLNWFGDPGRHGRRAQAVLADGETLLREKRYEAVALLCDTVRGDLLAMGAAERQPLLAKMERIAGIADDRRGQWTSACKTFARDLLALGKQYTAAGLPRAAVEMCRSARRFDPAAAEPRLVEAQAALRQQVLAQGKPEELQPPVADADASLPAWFGKGRPLVEGQTGWALQGADASVAALPAGAWTCLRPEVDQAGTKASAHVHLPEPGMAVGFVFAVRSPLDYSVCCLRRDEQAIWLEVRRIVAGRWGLRAWKRLEVPEWRLQGWFELQLQVGLGAALATVGDAHVRPPAADLGDPTGPIGLFAANGTDRPQAILMRGLRFRE